MMRLFLVPLLAWNAWLVVSFVARFHLPPSALSSAFTQYFLDTSFSFSVLIRNWAGFSLAFVDLAGVSALAWFAGGAVGRTVMRGRSGALVRLVAGFGLLGTAALGAGLAGLLFSPPAAATHLGLALLAGWTAFRTRTSWRAPKIPLPPLTLPTKVVLALSALVVAAGVLNVEISWDALTYHLRIPSFYNYRHKIFDVWHHYCAPFPSQGEMLFGLGLLWGGENLARFLNALSCILLVPATMALGREAGLESRWAPLALAFTPLFTALLTRAYIDPMMALFLTLALALLVRWWRRGGDAALVMGALLAGWGLSCKYTGVLFLAGALALAAPRLRGRSGWRAAGLWSLSALAPFLPWLAKNALFRGNPLWPYLGGVFGVSAEIPSDVTPFFESASPLAALARSLFDNAGSLVVGHGRVDGPLLPAIAGFLPLLALAPGGEGARLLRRAVLGYLALWMVLVPDVRFLLPMLPALLLLLDGALAEAVRHGEAAGKWARGFMEAGLAAGAIYGACIQWVFYAPFTLTLGLEDAHRKLELGLEPPPWTSYAKDFINANTPPDSRVMFLSHFSSYYFERECIVDFHFGNSHIAHLIRERPTAEAMEKRLRQLGISWLLDAWMGSLQYLGIKDYYSVPAGSEREFKRLLAEWGEPAWQTDNYTLYRLGRRHAPRRLPSLPVWGWNALRDAELVTVERPREALALLDAVPAWLQDVGATHLRRGDALNALGNPAEAVRAYRAALSAGMDVPRLHLGLSHALLVQGRAREALPHAEIAHRGNPLSAYNTANLATVEMSLGNLVRARELVGEAVRLSPGNPTYRVMLENLGGAP